MSSNERLASVSKTLQNIRPYEDFLSAQSANLPPLPAMQRLSPRVIRVLGGNPGKFTLQGTNTYIVGTGTSRLLVDTGQGIPIWIRTIADVLAVENITLSHVLLTHWHTDHTGGVPDLLTLCPDLTSSIHKHAPDAGQQPIRDGQTFSVEGATLTAVHTPGHAYDHMCFVLREENALFTGDNLLGHGTTVVEDLGLYMNTLRIMQAQRCASAYPAHGAVLPNLPAKLTEQLEQKLRRERRVLASLRTIRDNKQRAVGSLGDYGDDADQGGVSLRDLVVVVYGAYMDRKTRETVLEPATDEILGKLEAEGRVGGVEMGPGGKRWFLIDSFA